MSEFVGYSEVLTENQRNEKDRQARIEELLRVLVNSIQKVESDINKVKTHLSLITNEEF